jgi:hypothetical protein
MSGWDDLVSIFAEARTELYGPKLRIIDGGGQGGPVQRPLLHVVPEPEDQNQAP